MQIKKEEFNSEKHIKLKALSVQQPYAGKIADGRKTIEVRSRDTKLRGDLLICSTKIPHFNDLICGGVLCIVNLYHVKKFKDLTEEEKDLTCIKKENRHVYKNHYAWMLKDVRRVIEMPVRGGQGLWTLYANKDFILEYPNETEKRELTELEKKRMLEDRYKLLRRRAVVGILRILFVLLFGISILAGVIILIIKFVKGF